MDNQEDELVFHQIVDTSMPEEIICGEEEEPVGTVEIRESLSTVEVAEKQQKKKRNTSDHLIELFQNNSMERREFFKTALEKHHETHPIDSFFTSMAASVKNLSMERQIRAKMQISQIVGELELEQLDAL